MSVLNWRFALSADVTYSDAITKQTRANSSCSICDSADENARRDSGVRCVPFGQFCRNFLRTIALAQGYGGTTKPCASQPCAQNAWQFLCDGNEKIQFGRAVVEILTRAFV